MSRDLYGSFDGDQGPIFRWTLRDGPSSLDMNCAAVEVYIIDEDGVSYGMRPGVIIDPKSGGVVDVLLKGRELDWYDAVKPIYLVPRFYVATAPDGTLAPNLLLNPSFDTATGTSPARLPSNWTLVGARTATWDNSGNDPAPPAIYSAGTFQYTKHANTSEPDYIQQAPAVTLAIGDTLSVGLWHRGGVGAGEAKNNTHAIFFRPGAASNTVTQLEVGERDWYFATGSRLCEISASAATMGIDLRGTTMSNRYDEAFFFKGKWSVRHGYALRIPARAALRPPKASNQIAGFGSFEADSNGDGVADAWAKSTNGPTYSIERDPANVSQGLASQKVVLSDHSGHYLYALHRARFAVGETWQASVRVKTSGALGAGVGSGGFSLELRTDDMDNAAVQSTSTNFSTDTAGVFATVTASVTIANADRSVLAIRLNLNGKTGTCWIDDIQLKKV